MFWLSFLYQDASFVVAILQGLLYDIFKLAILIFREGVFLGIGFNIFYDIFLCYFLHIVSILDADLLAWFFYPFKKLLLVVLPSLDFDDDHSFSFLQPEETAFQSSLLLCSLF